jgi:hypothetical protein
MFDIFKTTVVSCQPESHNVMIQFSGEKQKVSIHVGSEILSNTLTKYFCFIHTKKAETGKVSKSTHMLHSMRETTCKFQTT